MGMGVAGIIVDSLIVSQWIIPIHSLLSTSKVTVRSEKTETSTVSLWFYHGFLDSAPGA